MPLTALNSLDISMVKYNILFWVSIGEKQFSSMLSIINHVLYMLYFLHSYPLRLPTLLNLGIYFFLSDVLYNMFEPGIWDSFFSQFLIQ